MTTYVLVFGSMFLCSLWFVYSRWIFVHEKRIRDLEDHIDALIEEIIDARWWWQVKGGTIKAREDDHE